MQNIVKLDSNLIGLFGPPKKIIGLAAEHLLKQLDEATLNSMIDNGEKLCTSIRCSSNIMRGDDYDLAFLEVSIFEGQSELDVWAGSPAELISLTQIDSLIYLTNLIEGAAWTFSDMADWARRNAQINEWSETAA